jgi:hypothetical protein
MVVANTYWLVAHWLGPYVCEHVLKGALAI